MSSTGQTIGAIGGAVAGFFLTAGNPLGALKGAAYGAALGGYIDPPLGPNLRGPTLDDKSFQSSAYGVPIPEIDGTIGTAGTVIYLENNEYKTVAKKESQSAKGGGGGGTVTTTTYYATFTVLLGKAMPGSMVRRIWLGGVLWYSAGTDDIDTVLQSATSANSNSGASGGGTWRYCDGTQTDPDSRMEAVKGLGNAPSYEGRALIHIYDLDLTDYGNGLAGCPVKVEIVQSPSYADELTVIDSFVVNGNSSADERSVRCLRPLSGFSSGYSSIIYWPFFDGGNYELGVSVRNPDKTWSFSVGNSENTDSNAGIGYSERATYCYRQSLSTPDEYYERWITDGGTYSLPDIYFSDIGFVLGSFKSIYDLGYRGVYFLISTNSFSVTPPPNKNIFWAYGAGDSDIYILDSADAAESLAISPPYFYLYRTSTNTIYQRNISDGSLVDDYLLSVSAADVYAACMNESYIIYLNATLDMFVAGEIIITIIDVSDFSSRRFTIDIDPVLAGSETSGYFPSMSIVDNILAISCISGDYDIKIYLINLLKIERNPVPLIDIISRKLGQCGLVPNDYDLSELADDYVDGYRISDPGSARGSLSPLQVAYLFDFVEHGYKLKAVKRGGSPVLSIPYKNLGASKGGYAENIISCDYETSTQLPVRYTISYIDFNREYDANTQFALYPGHGSNERNQQLAIVMSAEQAAKLADVLINLSWIERNPFKFSLPQTYLELRPTDVITVERAPGIFIDLRLDSVSITADQIIEISARPTRASSYQSAAVGSPALPPPETITRIGTSTAIMMDIPLVLDSMNFPGFVAGMYGSQNWPGGVLMSSADNGQVYVPLQAFTGKTTAGSAIDVLAENAGAFIDRTSELNVRVVAGEFTSITESQMMTGMHYLAYGAHGRWEIMQYINADPQMDGTVILSGFLRGLRGTEWATGLHQINDDVVLLDDPDNLFIGMQSSAIGVDRLYKAVTVKANTADTAAFGFKYGGVNLKPLSVVYVTGSRLLGEWVVEFLPRSRLSSSQWVTGQQAPMGENAELYDVDVYDIYGIDVLKTYQISFPVFNYSADQQIEDFGAIINTLKVAIYQISTAVGRGYPATKTFSASSDIFIDFVTLLMHFDGADNSTDFIDEIGHAVTPVGTPLIKTDEYMFGGSSAFFNGSSQYFNVASGDDFSFSGDFTIECWINVSSTSGTKIIFDSRAVFNSTNGFAFYVDGSTMGVYTDSVAKITTASLITATTWTHVALCRSGLDVRLFIAGVEEGIWSQPSLVNFNSGLVRIGNDIPGVGQYFGGHIDELRITKAARYIEDFTPPDEAFPNPEV